MSIFLSGLSIPEAPVLLPDHSWLFVEMGPERGCVIHASSDGKNVSTVAVTGRPNGLTYDRDGFFWVAETERKALLRMSLDGKYEVFADSCAGEPFVFLNDVAISPDGYVFLTDSGITMPEIAPTGEPVPNFRELPYRGKVYKINCETRAVELIDKGIKFTNGLAFGPDGALYVAETVTSRVYRYSYKNGEAGERALFADVADYNAPGDFKGPDGMKFGTDGNLYCAVYGQGHVAVVDKTGGVIKRIKTEGACPSNLAFGKTGEKRIYVTEGETGTVQTFDVGCDGYAVFSR